MAEVGMTVPDGSELDIDFELALGVIKGRFSDAVEAEAAQPDNLYVSYDVEPSTEEKMAGILLAERLTRSFGGMILEVSLPMAEDAGFVAYPDHFWFQEFTLGQTSSTVRVERLTNSAPKEGSKLISDIPGLLERLIEFHLIPQRVGGVKA